MQKIFGERILKPYTQIFFQDDGDSARGSSEDDEAPSSFSPSASAFFRLCACAERDLRMAEEARAEFRSLLNQLENAWKCEEKDMVGRAGWLRRESETAFEKMSPSALQRISSQAEDVMSSSV